MKHRILGAAFAAAAGATIALMAALPQVTPVVAHIYNTVSAFLRPPASTRAALARPAVPPTPPPAPRRR